MRLQGKTALITAAGQGMGRAAAEVHTVPGDGAGIGGEENESIDKILRISCHEAGGNPKLEITVTVVH